MTNLVNDSLYINLTENRLLPGDSRSQKGHDLAVVTASCQHIWCFAILILQLELDSVLRHGENRSEGGANQIAKLCRRAGSIQE